MLFCTSACANYLPKARLLAHSVKAVMPDSVFILCLVERDILAMPDTLSMFDEVITAEQLDLDDFESFIFRHTIVEAATAVKPALMQYLLQHRPAENKVVYLDPDVCVYAAFTELEHLLDEHSVVLTPHLLRPGNIDMELSALAHGCFNLGFLAVSRSAGADAFLNWWADRLRTYCRDDIPNGLFTDQRWIDLAPCFFEVYILKHHGYNFATWSLLHADMRCAGTEYTVNGDPLRFIHFSGTDSGTVDRAVRDWACGETRALFAGLHADYRKRLHDFDHDRASALPWSYGRYHNGEAVQNAARIAFRDGLSPCRSNPFAHNNKIHLARTGLRMSMLPVLRKLARACGLKSVRTGLRSLAASLGARSWKG